MPSWSILQPQKISWNELQNKPAILSDNQVSWSEIVNKPDLIESTNLTGLKCKVLTGTTAATQGSYVSIPYDKDGSVTEIISVTALVFYNPPLFSLNSGFVYSSGCYFDISTVPGFINIANALGNSWQILSKPIKITMIYRN